MVQYHIMCDFKKSVELCHHLAILFVVLLRDICGSQDVVNLLSQAVEQQVGAPRIERVGRFQPQAGHLYASSDTV